MARSVQGCAKLGEGMNDLSDLVAPEAIRPRALATSRRQAIQMLCDALAKAAALEDAIDRLTFAFKGRSVVAGASAGLALIGPGDDAVSAMEAADRALYGRKAARRGGRLCAG